MCEKVFEKNAQTVVLFSVGADRAAYETLFLVFIIYVFLEDFVF